MSTPPDFVTVAMDLGDRYAEIRLIYLFGSQVDGVVGPLSDVDVAVKLTE